jgi:hypothetical protein
MKMKEHCVFSLSKMHYFTRNLSPSSRLMNMHGQCVTLVEERQKCKQFPYSKSILESERVIRQKKRSGTPSSNLKTKLKSQFNLALIQKRQKANNLNKNAHRDQNCTLVDSNRRMNRASNAK